MVVVSVSLVLVFIGYLVFAYWQDAQKSGKVRAEQSKAAEAMRDIDGGPGATFVTGYDADGPYVEIELAPTGNSMDGARDSHPE